MDRSPSDLWSEDLKASEKPVLYFLTTDDARDKSRMNIVQSTVLMDERVATAAKFFNCVRMNGDSLEKDHALYSELKGKNLPRMVVLTSSGKKVGSIEGKVSPSRLYGMMKKSAEKEYSVRLDTLVKRHRDLLNQIDKLDGRKKVLASKEQRSEGRENSDIRKLRREIEVTELKLQVTEKKLFDVQRRDAKKARA